MDNKKYNEILERKYDKNKRILLDTLNKFSLKFNLKFNKKKFENLKYQKSSYYDNAKFSDLIKSFVVCYSILCVKGQINLPKRIEELTHTKGYDTDVITLLCILQKIHEANGEKITNSDLILVWGLVFDNVVYKEKKRWDDDMWKMVKKQKMPSEYIKFFETKDDKYLKKNSFQKYKNKLDAEKIKNFMIAIFENIKSTKANSLYRIYIEGFFDKGFYIYVCNLRGMIFPRFEEKNLTNNFDKILNLYSKGTIKSQFESKNSKVLDYIYRNCRDIFAKSFY